MRMTRVLIQLPQPLKARLDALREHGTTVSGYIRALIKRELKQAPTTKKGR